MARFYNTDKATFVDDIMYQAPYELMLNALKTQDDAFDKNKETLGEFASMAEGLEYIDVDRETRDQILGEHQNIADDLAQKMDDNPALFQAYAGDINRARRNFERDIKTGSLFEMDRQAKRRAQAREDLKKQYEAGKYEEDAYNAALAVMDLRYKGYGNGDYAEGIHIYEKVDSSAYAEHLKRTITPDIKNITTTEPDGKGYSIGDGLNRRFITEDKLKSIVTKDPQFEKWANGQLQTLEREAEMGLWGDVTESESNIAFEFERRKDDFINSTIKKLEFEEYTKTDTKTTDTAYFEKDKSAREWDRWNFDKSKQEAGLNDFNYELDVEYEELSDAAAAAIWGSDQEMQGGPYADGYDFEHGMKEISDARKKEKLLKERGELEKAMARVGMPEEVFRTKMATIGGRSELSIQLGLPADVLARQANYNLKVRKKSVKDPGENKNAYDNIKYANAVTTAIRNLSYDTDVKYVVSVNGVIEELGETALGNLGPNGKGLLKGAVTEVEVEELIPIIDDEYGAGFAGKDGKIITVADPNDDTKIIAASEAQVLATGKGATKKVKRYQQDKSKPILSNTVPTQVYTTEETTHHGTFAPKTVTYYNVDYPTVVRENGKDVVKTVTIKTVIDVDKEINLKK